MNHEAIVLPDQDATTFVSIDPGLDLAAAATWRWQHGSQRPETCIRGVTEVTTDPDLPIGQRLDLLAAWVAALVHQTRPLAVFIERSNRGTAYDRNKQRAAAVMRSLYWSHLAAGALVLGAQRARAGTIVELLEVGTVKKHTKQEIAARVLQCAGLAPAGRKRKWGPDTLDAVAVGMQVMSEGRWGHLTEAYRAYRDSAATPAL